MGLLGEDSQLAILNYIEEIFDISFDGQLQSLIFDAVSLDHDSIRGFFTEQANVSYYSHVFKEHEVNDPYFPFLTMIRQQLQTLEKDEVTRLLDKLNIYQLHKSVFMSFVFDEDYHRESDVLRDEVYFEQLLFHDEISRLLDYMANVKDTVIYLGDLHYANESTISMIEYMIRQYKKLNIMLVMSFDTDSIDYEDDNLVYHKFIDTIEELDLVIRVESEFFSEAYNQGSLKVREEKVFRNLETCYEFLAIEDCIKYGKALYIDYNNHLSKDDQLTFIRLLKLLGKTHFLKKDGEGALFYNNMALSLAIDMNHQWEICDMKIRLGYVYSIQSDFSIGRKHAQDAYDMAKELGYERLVYDSLLLHFIIDKDSLYIDAHSSEERLQELIKMTKTLGYSNYLSMIYTNPQELHDNFTAEKEERFDEGIQIATELGNEHQLGVAYHNRGIVYSRLGKNDLAYEYYRKSQDIKERIGDRKRVSYIYNSLGFYYFVIEKYRQANDEFIKSFNASTKTRDYHEVCMTLYNMAVNAFLYGKYHIVCDYINKLIKLMKTAKQNEIRYHSKKMIFDLYIIALLKSGKENKARDIYNKSKIWGLKPIENKDEEYFIGEMMEFFMAGTELSKESHLNNAEVYIDINISSLWHFRKFYYLEKIAYYKDLGSNYYKNLGKTFMKELDGSIETKRKLEHLMDIHSSQELVEGLDAWSDFESSYKQVVYMAKIDQNLMKLRNRINEISFLNIVQNMLVNEDKIDKVFLRLQQLIHGNTKVEKIYCRMIKSKGYSTLNLDNQKLVINEVYADRIFTYVKDKTKANLIHLGNANLLTLKKVYGYSSLMYLPIYVKDKRKAEFIFMTQRQTSKLVQDDLSIFTLVARQVGENIERIENNRALKTMNAKLQHLSNTDILTNLSNRNALEERLQELKTRIEDYSLQDVTFLFIDLDHFKYYNDSFGHKIGDQVLIYFADILKEVFANDFIARFGGDEFVIILEDCHESLVRERVSSIYKKIEEHHYFQRAIGQILGKRIVIPDEHFLSCSVGMSSMLGDDNRDVDLLFKLSDAAVYQAKRKGRHRLEASSKRAD